MNEQLKYILPLLALGAAVGFYFAGAIPEATVGAILAGAALLLPSPYAAKVLSDLSPRGMARWGLLACGVAAAVWAVLPVYEVIQPGQAKYQGQVSDTDKTTSLGQTESGAYLLTVEAVLPEREGEVTADYRLKISSGDQSTTVDGSLWRRLDNVRVGRRGTAVQEHKRTFERHPITLANAATDVALVRTTGDLPGGLHFSLHKVLVPAAIYWAIAALVFLAAAVLETRYSTEKNRSLFTTAVAFSMAFAAIYPNQMTQDAMVRPAVGSAIAAGLIGIALGGTVSWLLRKTLGRSLRLDQPVRLSVTPG